MPTHTYTHAHLGGSRALVLAHTKCPPLHPTGSPRRDFFFIIITTASQVPELLCQSTDWINWKFYEVCGHLKWFSPVKSQYTPSQCQHVPPYIRFEGVVELCSWCWLVVAVRQRDKQKGSILHHCVRTAFCELHLIFLKHNALMQLVCVCTRVCVCVCVHEYVCCFNYCTLNQWLHLFVYYFLK